MGLFSLEKLFGITLRESANDGSDFTNPDADYRRVFLGEDGEWHSKDSAGTVVTMGGAVADIVDIPTAEMDDTLVLAPDGAGGVEFRAETGGYTRSTLGTTSVGGSFDNTRNTFIKSITLAADGFLMSINAHVKGDGSDQATLRAVVLTDAAGTPSLLRFMPAPSLDTGGSILKAARLNTTARWVGLSVGIWLPAGTYWVGVNTLNSNDGDLEIAYASSGSDRVGSAATNIPGDNSIFSTTAAAARNYSIYADILS